MGSEGGGRDLVQKIRVEPQLQIMERLGYIMSAASSKNLGFPLKYNIMTAPSFPVASVLGL